MVPVEIIRMLCGVVVVAIFMLARKAVVPKVYLLAAVAKTALTML